ncbi:hypothetical protein [Saccharopolyspora gregorii]|uniref:Uncharacterized protein n=1 Tax=Saccharopolyspora gregorii TaxID=33914 RepID=A0ABP6RK62_9PSEU
MVFPGKPAWQSLLWLFGILVTTPVTMLLEFVIFEGFDGTRWPPAVMFTGGSVAAVVLLIAPRLGPRALPAAAIGAAVISAAVYYPAYDARGWPERPTSGCCCSRRPRRC